jgi:Mg/Co/Ni transporter MgtE
MYAVGVLSYFDNELKIEFVEAASIKEAVAGHSMLKSDDMSEWLEEMPDDLETLKEHFFNGDMAVDVKEIPE